MLVNLKMVFGNVDKANKTKKKIIKITKLSN